jgi:hypothetical protein
MADEGLYIKDAVDALRTEYGQGSKDLKGRPESEVSARGLVRVYEFWGTVIDKQGNVIARNVYCTVANDKHLLQKLTDNPFWHQRSPFVVAPLLREPHSVYHRGAYDDAAQLNIAYSELFNLILDGGAAAVWGIKELRQAALEDPSQVSDGISHGDTLLVKEDWPANIPAVNVVRTGAVPQDAGAVLEMLDREFNGAAFTNDLKLGQMPSKQVRATEVVEASQSHAMTLDSIVNDLENTGLRPVLWLAWCNIMQFLPHMSTTRTIAAIGDELTMQLTGMDENARRQLMTTEGAFNVFGMSGLITRARDLQRLLPMLDFIMKSSILAPAFIQKYDPTKLLDYILKLGEVDLKDVQLDPSSAPQAAAPGAMPGTMPGAPMGMPREGGGPAMPAGGGAALPGAQNRPAGPAGQVPQGVMQ